MSIYQQIKNVASRMQLKTVLALKGETLTNSEAAMAFNIKKAEKDIIAVKMHQYPEINNFLLGFLNSAAIEGKILGDNLTFIIGPEGMGKTTQIEKVLNTFRRIKVENKKNSGTPEVHRYISPEYFEWQSRTKQFDNQHFILISHDYRTNPSMNFSSFLNHLHQSMIGEILRLNSKLGEKLLDPKVIREVLLAENAEEFLFVYLKDVIYSIINGCDPLFLSQENINKLSQLNQSILKVEAGAFFEGNLYDSLIELLSKSLKVSETEAAVRLFLSVGKRIEYEHRDESFQHSWYESGIQSTNILMDLLNFVCGFGKLNKKIVDDYFSEKSEIKPTQNWVKSGNRADVALCLMNLDSLYIWDSPELWNFIDHLISRTAAANGLRNHFPIIIEIPSSADVEDLLAAGQFELGTVPFIEIPGYLHHTLYKSSLSKVFPPKVIKQLFNSLGRSPNMWAKAIEELGKGTTFNQIVNGSAEFMVKEGIRAEAKFNRVFTSIEAQEALYQGHALTELVQHLRLFRKSRGLMIIDRPGIYIDFVTRPLFQAMQRENLAYHYFYLPYVDLTRLSYLPSLMNIKSKILRANLIDFMRWRLKNRSRFTIYGPEVKYKEKFEKEAINFNKFVTLRTDYQLGQTYYGGLYNYIFRYAKKGATQEIV